MLLTITNTRPPATDLGFLLHKHPRHLQSFNLSFGTAHVFYTEADEERCTAALLLDVDAVGLTRKNQGRGSDAGTLGQYVNDRAYVVSSFLSVALAQVYASALGGRCTGKPELPEIPLPLTATVYGVSAGGAEDLTKLFTPLGYAVEIVGHPLDPETPDWGLSKYYTLTLSGNVKLHKLLSHLYVLLPCLDNKKHYFVGDEEVEKLLSHGKDWLPGHPEQHWIVTRYLRNKKSLTRAAMARLADLEEEDISDAEEPPIQEATEPAKRRENLHAQRLASVAAALKSTGATRVLDLGCGEGRLLELLLPVRQFKSIVGMDVSNRALDIASDRLHLDRMPPMQRERIHLMQGSLIYQDSRLAGFDAAALVEVIEHLDPPRLAALERVLFEFARPSTVVLTTPNAEYNVLFPTLPAGKMRHGDHRFEWTRAEFDTWCSRVAGKYNYRVTLSPVGPVDESVGAPSQMAVFTVSDSLAEAE